MPGRLLCWAREHRYSLDVINTATNWSLIMLPAHTGSVVDKGALAEWVRNARWLWSKPRRLLLLVLELLLLLLLLLRSFGGNVASKRVGARGLGLYGLGLERARILAWRVC